MDKPQKKHVLEDLEGPALSLATPPDEVEKTTQNAKGPMVPMEIEDRIIRISDRLSEINSKLPTQKEKFSKLAFKAFLQGTRTIAICLVIFYALSFDLTQRGVSKAFEYLNFGQGSRTNFALHLIAAQKDHDQFKRAINLVTERLDNILHSHFTLEEGSIMTNASFLRLEELRSYEHSAKEFELEKKVKALSEQYMKREIALFIKQLEFSLAKDRHGYQGKKALEGLKKSLLAKDYEKALHQTLTMPSYVYPSTLHAKRIAFYGLHISNRAALQTALAEHKLQK